MTIDTTFDVRTDAGGKDPDAYSATLRRYHRQLWSKALPNGAVFELTATRPGAYLYHCSDLGEFFLSSDSILASFTRWSSLMHITSAFPEEEHEAFRTAGYTIGGMMIFPANKVDGKLTINMMRGLTRRISDRFDLTLECIRRHYLGLSSPLAETLARYSTFFALFGDFKGYVDFFLVQDLVSDDYAAVRFFMPFDDFHTSAVPRDCDEYREFRRRSLAFLAARNSRIEIGAI